MELLLIILLLLCIISVVVRVIVLHPINSVKYSISDFIHFIKYHKWNEATYGYIKAYIGLFGKGKT